MVGIYRKMAWAERESNLRTDLSTTTASRQFSIRTRHGRLSARQASRNSLRGVASERRNGSSLWSGEVSRAMSRAI